MTSQFIYPYKEAKKYLESSTAIISSKDRKIAQLKYNFSFANLVHIQLDMIITVVL